MTRFDIRVFMLAFDSPESRSHGMTFNPWPMSFRGF